MADVILADMVMADASLFASAGGVGGHCWVASAVGCVSKSLLGQRAGSKAARTSEP